MTLKLKTLTAILFIGSNLFAQSDATSKNILAALSKKFKTYEVVKTDFTLALTNAQDKSKQNLVGVLYLKSKTNQYKIVFAGQEILSDGKTQWTYLKDDNEVQLNNVSKNDDAINPAQIFTTYTKGYKTKYNGDNKVGNTIYQNIELVPIATRSFFKLKMKVDKLKNELYSLIIFDKNGNTYSYTIKKLTPVTGIADAFFVWDKKKFIGVDVQDLR